MGKPKDQDWGARSESFAHQGETYAYPPLSDQPEASDRSGRMSETVRQVVTSRERAPRSPGMERALKQLIWRYTEAIRKTRTGRPEADQNDGRPESGRPRQAVEQEKRAEGAEAS